MLRYYLVALTVCITGMFIHGLIRPYIVFHTLEEQGMLYVALLTTGFMLARGFTSLYTGLFIKRYGFTVTGSLGLTLWFIVLYMYLYIPSSLYPLVRVIEGFSAGLLWPTMQALAVSSIPFNWRNRGLSIYFVSGSLVYNLGVWIGGFLRRGYGVYGLFYPSMALTLSLVLFYIVSTRGCVYRGSSGSTGLSLGVYRRVFSKTIDLVPLVIAIGGIAGLSLDYLLAYSKEVSGFDYSVARLYWGYAGYIGLVMSLLLSYIADRVGGGYRVSYLAVYLMSIALALASIPLQPLLLYTLLSIPVMGVRITRPLIRGVVLERERDREIAITYTNTLSNIGAAIAPLLVTTINTVTKTNINIGVITYTLTILAIITITHCSQRKKERKP